MMKILLYIMFLIPISFLEWYNVVIFLMLIFFFIVLSFPLNFFFSFMSYSMGGDLLSLVLIMLSIWISFLMIFASLRILFNKNFQYEFLLMVLLLLVFLMLAFMVTSLLYFYIFFEASLIPTMIIIFGWGYQPERLSAGLYMLFYTLFASLPLLIGIFFLYNSDHTMNMFLIGFVGGGFIVYLSLILAFLVKIPMFLFHYWLPSAHVEAPVSGSMILAGVLLKLGGYGIIRFFWILSMFSVYYNYLFISLSLYGMIVVSFICLFQYDIKSLIAYSSVSHMSLALMGLFTLSGWGFYGSLLLMISHGLCSSGLFCLSNINYERVCSRSFYFNSGFLCICPSLSFFWFMFSVNNMASPPSLNLLGEILLINSIFSWSLISMSFLMLSSFFSCCYSIYLYSSINHGSMNKLSSVVFYISFREFFLLFFHVFPLNVIFMKVDLFTMFF
nr:NADH dehydrogenase subunit 4 [Hypselosoma matsumurae]